MRQLPLNPKQRFAALFAIKPQWEASELEPYLRGLQVSGLYLLELEDKLPVDRISTIEGGKKQGGVLALLRSCPQMYCLLH